MNPYVVVPDKSQYVDQQILKLQEAPETIPTGEMPRHVTVMIDRHLVGRAVPGTRVVVTGISQIYQSASAKSMGDAAVRHPYLKVAGLEINTDGAGRVSSKFTQEETNMFLAVSRRPDVYDVLSKSIAPAVWGHDDIKKAVACQLFGGCRKRLPDGMRLRGDINVLLLGDPGTAKSQLLKFVEKVAPIGVYTSGKGSSAAGLTASVVRDPASVRHFSLDEPVAASQMFYLLSLCRKNFI
jgi:DNA replication licensing factor MCM5